MLPPADIVRDDVVRRFVDDAMGAELRVQVNVDRVHRSTAIHGYVHL